MQSHRGEPAGRNADEPQRACDPVGAGALPVVEAGAITISATAWLPGSISATQAGSLTKSSCGADGELEPLTSGSARAVAQVVTHAGIVKIRRYAFDPP